MLCGKSTKEPKSYDCERTREEQEKFIRVIEREREIMEELRAETEKENEILKKRVAELERLLEEK